MSVLHCTHSKTKRGVDRSSHTLCPMIAVNTTAGTASEITRFCIITDTSRHVKMAIVDWRVTPQIAINNPNLMVGMPPALTAGSHSQPFDDPAAGAFCFITAAYTL